MKIRMSKGKLVIIAVVITLFAGAGIVFANTDAGEALKEWYADKFGLAVDEAEEEATDYGEEVYEELAQEYEEIKDDAAIAIDETRAEETENARNEIEARKNEHIDSLEDAQAEIVAQMTQDFHEVFQEGWLEIQTLKEEAIEFVTDDLEGFTNEQGDEAIMQLEEDLTEAEEEAVAELEDAIEQAKAELGEELDTHSGILADNWMKEIDYAANDLRSDVDELVSDFVADVEDAIEAKAVTLTEDAFDALDDVVNDMDK